MHTRTMRAVFRRTLVTALMATGCSPYGIEGNTVRVVSVPPGATLTANARGNLPAEVCRRACKPLADSRITGNSCHAATLISPPAPGEPLIVCDLFVSSGWQSAPFFGSLPSGRAPRGLQSPRIVAHDAVAAYFAQLAHLEAASVIAFGRLADDLARHDAPLTLRRRARRAARDESRHARAASRLARDADAKPPPVRVPPHVDRSLEAIARENVVEGCVRETYAAHQ